MRDRDAIRVAPFPFADNADRPNVWVDMFAIDWHVRGRTLADARAFIRSATSLAAFRALLVPRPATSCRRARLPSPTPRSSPPPPLLSPLHAIVEGGTSVSGLRLARNLRAAAVTIDAALAETH